MFSSLAPQTLASWVFFTALGAAAAWSFVLDRHKPPGWGELFAKFAARALFLLVLMAVLLSFLYLLDSVIGSYRS